MIKETTIVLFREDMHLDNQKKSFDEIFITDFKFEVYEAIKQNGIVVFVDTDLRTKMLKNRYGNPT